MGREKKEEKVGQRIRDLKEIAIAIDSWDDIFDDFDPRPLGQRTVSGDFIDELRRRYAETRSGNFVITIYAPSSLKDEKAEKMVNQRLKKHFRYRFLQRRKDIVRIRIRGAIFVCIGVSSLSFLTLAAYFKFLNELTTEILSIILMPLGWFGFWEGLSKLIDTSPAFIREEKLFQRLSRISYRFNYLEQ